MITKIAWRNIWRNPTRSWVIIIAVALGLWAGIFASAFVLGMTEQKIQSVIELEMSHFQIHHPEFREEFQPKDTIAGMDGIREKLVNDNDVVAYSERVSGMFMMASPNKSGAMRITGIDPEKEREVTVVSTDVVEGSYLDTDRRNPILISSETAEDYKIKIRSKVVVTIQDVDGEITAGAFRVVGIYKSDNNMYDQLNAFVKKEDLQQLLGLETGIHEVAVLLKAHELADTSASAYQSTFPDLEILSWADLSPGMRYFIEAKDTYTLIIVGIILVALLFSVLNAMLMAVLERVREIGMLMAVGMNKVRTFRMIMLETIFLVSLGGPLGLLLSWLSIQYFGNKGIDLGGAAYAEVGFSNIVYPYLDFKTYAYVTIMVVAMAIIAAIYPALKALSLNPIQAIHKS